MLNSDFMTELGATVAKIGVFLLLNIKSVWHWRWSVYVYLRWNVM